LKVTPEKRATILDARRAMKMARSVHAYVRGNTAQFYEWLEASPVMAHVPVGPQVWICGDCHLGNLGPLADRHHDFAVQIRDLDQTVIGNPALDLIRLGLSLETAARSSDLPGVVTAQMLSAMIDGYGRALSPEPEDDPVEPKVVRSVRRRAAGRKWRHLADERIEGTAPTLPLGKRFWQLTEDERAAVDALFDDPAVRMHALAMAAKERCACWTRPIGARVAVRWASCAMPWCWAFGQRRMGQSTWCWSISSKPGLRWRQRCPVPPCLPFRPSAWWPVPAPCLPTSAIG
jgi:uncharacterized protein (DUF2252 family)